MCASLRYAFTVALGRDISDAHNSGDAVKSHWQPCRQYEAKEQLPLDNLFCSYKFFVVKSSIEVFEDELPHYTPAAAQLNAGGNEEFICCEIKSIFSKIHYLLMSLLMISHEF